MPQQARGVHSTAPPGARPAPPIARAARVTRSQSREPPEPIPGPRDEPAWKKPRAGIAHLNQELEEVAEEYEEDEDEDVEDESSALPARGRLVSEAAMSGPSQGTARTSFSDDEIASLNPIVMLDRLKGLAEHAAEVIRYICPPGATSQTLQSNIKSLGDPTSSFREIFGRRLESFQLYKGDFTSHAYLRPDFVLRALLNSDTAANLPSAAWRPDDILFQANLAQLIQEIFTSTIPGEVPAVLSSLLASFPGAFTTWLSEPTEASGEIGESLLADDTEYVTTLLRTQLVIEMLATTDVEGSKTVFLTSTFLETPELEEFEADRPDLYRDVVSGLSFTQSDGTAFTHFPRRPDAILERMGAIQRTFNDGKPDRDTAIKRLRSQFPLDGCLSALLLWVQKRDKEVQRSIAGRGGTASICAQLHKEVQRHGALEASEQPLETSAPVAQGVVSSTPRGTPTAIMKSFASKSAMERLKQGMRASLPAQQPAPVRESAPIAEQDDWVPPLSDEEDYDEPDARHGRQVQPVTQINRAVSGISELARIKAAAAAQHASQQEQQTRRPARFIDTQVDGERVQFDDEPSQRATQQQPAIVSIPGSSGGTSVRRPSKRPREEPDEEDIDPTQDAGFETDTRIPRVARQPAPLVARSASVRPVTTRTIPIERTSTASRPSSTFEPFLQPQMERRNPGQIMPTVHYEHIDEDGIPVPTPAEQRRDIDLRAKSRMREYRKEPRERVPWSAEEEQTLLELLAEYGAQYAQMKRADSCLGAASKLDGRTPEDFRFKLRGLKVKSLIEENPMPANFDQVVLGKKEKDQLAAAGVYYDAPSIRNR